MEFANQSMSGGYAGAPGLGWRAPSSNKSAVPPWSDDSRVDVPAQVAIDVDGRDDKKDEGVPYGRCNAAATVAPQRLAWTFSVPFLGRMQILKDKIGLVMSFIIVLYWVYGNWSTWLSILIPRYIGGQIPVGLLILYAIISVLCITSFVRASTMNPGSLSASEPPQGETNVCQKCFLTRLGHTHHCRRCGHCVRKMDHHCPWINNCVGEDNQFAFMLLLVYAYTLSLVTLMLDIMHMFFMPPCLTCDKDNFMVIHQTAIMWTAIVMAIMMTCGAFGLYFSQHLSIVFETPSMEWARIQQEMFLTGKPPTKWPQQKETILQVYRNVCGSGLMLLWFLPCRSGRRRSLLRRHHQYV